MSFHLCRFAAPTLYDTTTVLFVLLLFIFELLPDPLPHVGSASVNNMEAQLLRDMIADRDHAIEKIKRKSQEQLDKEADLLSTLERIRSEAKEQSERNQKEKAELVNAQRVAYERLHLVQADFGRQCSSLHAYCKNAEKEKRDDPSYVMRMQAQLCKAMHSMGITDHQMELVEKHSEAIIKAEKETLSQCTDEKTQSELKSMNDLMAIDIQQREAKAGFESRLGEIFAEQEVLTKQIQESHDSDDDTEPEDDDDDEEEELDEEEKQAKEEMMRVLTERKQEIVRLEKEKEENEDTISELEEQLEELDITEHIEKTNGSHEKKQNGEADEVDVNQKDDGDRETSEAIPSES